MQDQCARVETNQNVFRAPLDAAHALAAHGRFEVGRDGPAQTALAHDCLDHAPPEQGRCNAAPGRFYFRELGRVTARAGLDYLIFDSL